MRKKKNRKTPPKVDELKTITRLLTSLREEAKSDNTSPTRLSHVAKSILSQPPRLDELKTTITARLNKITYPYPEERDNQRTFIEWLRTKGKGADKILFGKRVLKSIDKALKLAEIARRDSQYEEEQLSGQGLALRFHRAMLHEIERHANHVEELRREYDVPESWSSDYECRVGKQQIKELLAITSYRWSGDRKEITGTGWDCDLAAAILVYRVLRPQLTPPLKNASLLMLAPIIASQHDLPDVSPHALRMALSRR